jgi:hypothetical protein
MKCSYILSFLVFFLSVSSIEGIAPMIISAENRSGMGDALIALGTRLLPLKEGAHKKCSLPIPFVPFQEYHHHDILEQLYIPEQALTVRINDLQWALWRDERGIIVVPIYIYHAMSREDALPKPNKILSGTYRLIIAPEGGLKLEPCSE